MVEPAAPRFGICRCYYWRNFFVHRWGEHLDLVGGLRDRGGFLREFSHRQDREAAWEDIQSELTRRLEFQPKLAALRATVRESYRPLHPELWRMSEGFLDERFLRIVEQAKEAGRVASPDVDRLGSLAFSFPVFGEGFCRMLVEEVRHFNATDLPRNRPNTMNKLGLILDDLGLTPLMDSLREDYVQPVADALLGPERTFRLDSHRAFTVTYVPGPADLAGLHRHHDNAEVTLNVALDDCYDGGDLAFAGFKTEPFSTADLFGYQHVPGRGVLHLGALRHEALPVERGERTNLIVWMRSSEARRKECTRCGNGPDVEEVEVGYGDGFIVE